MLVLLSRSIAPRRRSPIAHMSQVSTWTRFETLYTWAATLSRHICEWETEDRARTSDVRSAQDRGTTPTRDQLGSASSGSRRPGRPLSGAYGRFVAGWGSLTPTSSTWRLRNCSGCLARTGIKGTLDTATYSQRSMRTFVRPTKRSWTDRPYRVVSTADAVDARQSDCPFAPISLEACRWWRNVV
jgi:hypothetical protein